MTAAQIHTAAYLCHTLEGNEVVSFREMGSEGSILAFGEDRSWKNSWLIARDGHAQHREGGEVSYSEVIAFMEGR